MFILTFAHDMSFQLCQSIKSGKSKWATPYRTISRQANLRLPSFNGFSGSPGAPPLAPHGRQETLQRREELFDEPGDAVLLADAVCSECLGCSVGFACRNGPATIWGGPQDQCVFCWRVSLEVSCDWRQEEVRLRREFADDIR